MDKYDLGREAKSDADRDALAGQQLSYFHVDEEKRPWTRAGVYTYDPALGYASGVRAARARADGTRACTRGPCVAS